MISKAAIKNQKAAVGAPSIVPRMGLAQGVRFGILFLLMPGSLFAGLDWTFQSDGVGHVLSDASWAVVRPLEYVAASSEFKFPLQLVWHSQNRRKGLFGSKWYCPQLESTLIPGKENTLIWHMPSGKVMGLYARRGNSTEYIAGMDWTAKKSGSKVEICNREGWMYLYRNGLLWEVHSPTGRILDFQYRNTDLSRVILRDKKSNTSRVVVNLKHQRDVVTELVSGMRKHRFKYSNGQPQQLAEHEVPGVAKPEKYTYNGKTGALWTLETASGLTSRFQNEPTLRLTDDGTWKYAYLTTAGSLTIEAVNAAGEKMSVTNDPRRGTFTREAGGVKTVTYYYRAPGQRYDGRLRRVERNGNVIVDHAYDPKTGRLVEARDAAGQIQFYEYAPLTDSVDSSHPLYDKPVRILKGTRKSQEQIAAFAYNDKAQVTEMSDAMGQKTAFQYSLRGEVSAVTSPDGRTVQFRQDSLGNILSVGDGAAQQKAGYDEITGKVKFRQLPDGQYVNYVYDDYGRVKEIQQRHTKVAAMEYDELGRIVVRRDGLNRETRFRYDARGNLLEELQPNGAATQYEYDARDLRTAQIDGKGNCITFKYDEKRALIEQSNPLKQKLTWSRDDKGRLTERTNGVQTTKYGFDDKDRLRVINYGGPGEKIVQTFDEKGRMVRAATPTTSISLTYDALNRVMARQLVRGETDRVIRYTYNASGKRTAVILSEKTPGGDYRLLHQTEYAYDPAGNLTELKANGRMICRYGYDPIGRLVRREYSNGIVASYGYDDFGRLSRVNIEGGSLLEPMLLAYKWDVVGQVTRRIWNKEMQNFTYDGSGQLLASEAVSLDRPPSAKAIVQKVSLPAASLRSKPRLVESYRYDAAGNIVEKFEHGLTTTMTYDVANQLKKTVTSASLPMNTPAHPEHSKSVERTFTYDAAGRQIRVEGPEGVVERRYGWLDKVVRLKKADGTVLGFDYYPDGQLAVKGPIGQVAGQEVAQPEAVQKAPEKKKKSSFDFLRSLIAQADTAPELDESLVASPEQRALQVQEEFVWDDLALLWKNGTGYAVEPHPSGGTCVAAFHDPGGTPTYFLNDILGTTLAVIHPDRVEVVPMTAFGKPLKKPAPALQEENLPSPQTPLSPEAQPQEIAENNKINTP